MESWKVPEFTFSKCQLPQVWAALHVGACTEPGGWKFSRDSLEPPCPAHTGVVMEHPQSGWGGGTAHSHLAEGEADQCMPTDLPSAIPSSLARLFLLKNNPKGHDFQNPWGDGYGRGKAENYLEEGRHRLSFEGWDLCTWCLMKIWKKIGNIFISQKNWCKTCQCFS